MNLNCCVVLLVLQIAGYIYCFRKNIRWIWLCQLAFQVICTAYPIAMCFYYDANPSYGLEALNDLGGFALSMTAGFVFGICLIATILTLAARWHKMRSNVEKKKTEEGRWW